MYFLPNPVQVKLFNANSFISSTTNKRFSFANTYNYQNMNVIGMALNGLDAPDVLILNFTCDPTYSFSNNSFVITLIPDSSNAPMHLLTYSIIVVNSLYPTMIDLQNACI